MATALTLYRNVQICHFGVTTLRENKRSLSLWLTVPPGNRFRLSHGSNVTLVTSAAEERSSGVTDAAPPRGGSALPPRSPSPRALRACPASGEKSHPPKEREPHKRTTEPNF